MNNAGVANVQPKAFGDYYSCPNLLCLGGAYVRLGIA